MRGGARTCPKCGSSEVHKIKTKREKFLICVKCAWSKTLFKYPENDKNPGHTE